MIRRGGAFALVLAFALVACGEEATQPPVEVPAAGLFYEPRSFCLPAAAAGDTLYLHNMGDGSITWTAERVPAGSTNLDGAVTVESGTIVAIVWTWPAPGVLPAVDSLVVTTTDPGFSRIVVPFRREAADYVDVDPPPAPVLALPEDGAIFHPGDRFTIMWSRVSDCSGVADYQVQISDSPSFSRILLSQSIAATSGVIEVDPGDADLGRAWWRVRARDVNGLSSPWSVPRSWTVESVSG